MGFRYYSHTILLYNGCQFSLSALKNKLEETYKKSARKISISAVNEKKEDSPIGNVITEEVTVTIDNYNFFICLNKSSYIQEEAEELVQWHERDINDSLYNKEAARRSTRRLEIVGEDDPDMDYFNDSLYILEAIESFNDLVILK